MSLHSINLDTFVPCFFPLGSGAPQRYSSSASETSPYRLGAQRLQGFLFSRDWSQLAQLVLLCPSLNSPCPLPEHRARMLSALNAIPDSVFLALCSTLCDADRALGWPQMVALIAQSARDRVAVLHSSKPSGRNVLVDRLLYTAPLLLDELHDLVSSDESGVDLMTRVLSVRYQHSEESGNQVSASAAAAASLVLRWSPDVEVQRRVLRQFFSTLGENALADLRRMLSSQSHHLFGFLSSALLCVIQTALASLPSVEVASQPQSRRVAAVDAFPSAICQTPVVPAAHVREVQAPVPTVAVTVPVREVKVPVAAATVSRSEWTTDQPRVAPNNAQALSAMAIMHALPAYSQLCSHKRSSQDLATVDICNKRSQHSDVTSSSKHKDVEIQPIKKVQRPFSAQEEDNRQRYVRLYMGSDSRTLKGRIRMVPKRLPKIVARVQQSILTCQITVYLKGADSLSAQQLSQHKALVLADLQPDRSEDIVFSTEPCRLAKPPREQQQLECADNNVALHMTADVAAACVLQSFVQTGAPSDCSTYTRAWISRLERVLKHLTSWGQQDDNVKEEDNEQEEEEEDQEEKLVAPHLCGERRWYARGEAAIIKLIGGANSPQDTRLLAVELARCGCYQKAVAWLHTRSGGVPGFRTVPDAHPVDSVDVLRRFAIGLFLMIDFVSSHSELALIWLPAQNAKWLYRHINQCMQRFPDKPVYRSIWAHWERNRAKKHF